MNTLGSGEREGGRLAKGFPGESRAVYGRRREANKRAENSEARS
jgi:hypothetical protein